ncbi:hypothetical protein BDV24DRAFT_141973 [Aspergillus arachidicola]|uniref:Uncharacterized protein n=1 Tax=Aspergillus arachidicola TaxID=656916 RepID=A0A5N6XTC6_9EURO|nr:hypothetical protein BDV24DRAFT_141973 [Aspergillus arachidicola]
MQGYILFSLFHILCRDSFIIRRTLQCFALVVQFLTMHINVCAGLCVHRIWVALADYRDTIYADRLMSCDDAA